MALKMLFTTSIKKLFIIVFTEIAFAQTPMTDATKKANTLICAYDLF